MERARRLFSYLPSDAECVLITSDINRRYFTSMNSSSGALVLFREGAGYFITDFRYIEKAGKTVRSCEVVMQHNIYTDLERIFKKHSTKKVLIESAAVTIEMLDRYKMAMPDIIFDTSSSLSRAIEKCRMVKEPGEIEKIRQAQELAQEALENTLERIEEGISEKDIALLLDYNMRKLGAEELSFPTIALGGKNTSMPHGVPSDKKIKKHEFVLMDFGAVVDGYHSDMTRTVCVGEPDEKMKSVYDIVLGAQERALSAAGAGISGRELDAAARDVIIKAGYGEMFGHSLGHGVGMEIHEEPVAAPSKKDTILEPGNIITIEPGIYIPEEFGVRIEDLTVITESGCRNLTTADKKLTIL